MSEWLGKPKPKIEDIRATHPSLLKDFPTIADYFIEDQKFRVTVSLEPGEMERFKAKVAKEFGEFTAESARTAAAEAVKRWVSGARK